MTANKYQELAMKFASPISTSTYFNLLLQGVMGMNGEAGEAIDIVKNSTLKNQSIGQKVTSNESV